MKEKKAYPIWNDVLLASFSLLLVACNLFNGISVSIVLFHTELMYTLFPSLYVVIAINFLFHIPALGYLIRLYHGTEKFFNRHWFTVIIGALSAMAPLVEWAALGDMADNIMEGFSSGIELAFIYLASVLHMIFILIFIKHIHARGQIGEEKTDTRIDDMAFKLVHGTGILTSAVGLFFCVFQAFLHIPLYRPVLVIFYSTAFFVPYGITFFVWKRTFGKAKLDPDEKQKADIAYGASSAFRIVLAVGFLLYLAGIAFPPLSERVQWYPLLFFMGLFMFSISVFRRSLLY